MSSAAFPSIPGGGLTVPPPFAELYDCHRRILTHCGTLRRLVLHNHECGPTRESQVASNELLRFFDGEVPRHCADEEEDLFPALIESMAGSDAVCLDGLTRGCTQQHRALAGQWARLRVPLEELAAGRAAALPGSAVEAFARQWYDHIAIEEGELLAMAARLLTDDEAARVQRRMQERRV